MKLIRDLITLIPSFYLPVMYALFIYSTQDEDFRFRVRMLI
jgi:hypothetical protein